MISPSPEQVLAYAASTGRLAVLPMAPLLRGKVRVVKVPGERDPAEPAKPQTKREGRVSLAVPDAVARNLKGPNDGRDILLVVHIPRGVFDEMTSPIIRA